MGLGSLKSLQVFAQQKKTDIAVRFNLDAPSLGDVETKILPETPHRFKLISLPMYLVSETERLCGLA